MKPQERERTVNVRLKDEVIVAVNKAAKHDYMTASALVRKAVVNHLRAQGYLADGK